MSKQNPATEQKRMTLSRESWELLDRYANFYDLRLGQALDRLISTYEPWVLKELGGE